MPLRQRAMYGGECPLGVFEIDIAAGGGCYTSDPLEGCLGNPELRVCSCNYIREPREDEKFDPAVQCMCPPDMTKAESRRLKGMYSGLVKQGKADKTKEGFWEFVRNQRASKLED
jgi:hypothetical protein